MSAKSDHRQPTEVLFHWYTLVDGIQFSAQDFYKSLESEIRNRRMPRLHTSHVEHAEGGIVSDKRIYLRFARERFAFDVCAAPFGTSYFFSLRLIEKARGGWFQVFIILCSIGALLKFMPRGSNPLLWLAGALFVLLIACRVILLSQPKSLRAKDGPFGGDMPDFDGFLLNLSWFGPWYEKVRKDTYYRHDTRLLFQTSLSDLVKKKVEEVASAKGAKLLSSYEYSPILGELYKRTVVMAAVEEKRAVNVVD